MDEQMINILETVNEGLNQLPTYASEGWNLMVNGVRLDGIIWLLISFSTLLLLILFWSKFIEHIELDSLSQDTYFFMISFSIVIIVVAFAGIFINMRAVIMPEYHLIKQIMSTI